VTGTPTAAAVHHVAGTTRAADATPSFSAAAARDGLQGTHLRFAGRSVHLEATGDLLDAFTPAFGHLVQPQPAPLGALRLRVWEDDEQPHPLWDLDAPEARRTADGGLVARGVPGAAPHLEAFRPGIGIELWGGTGALHHPDHTLRPAGRSTFAWADQVGLRLLHVAAVEHDGLGVLLVGPSGAGKTTTVLAAAARGLGVVGDDTCLVDVSTQVVHSLYGTSAVNQDTLGRSDAGDVAVLGEAVTGKVIVQLAPRGRLVAQAPIAALVVLRPEGEVTGPRALGAAEAAKALAAGTVLPGIARDSLGPWFRDVLRLAREVPAFEVARGWDLDRVVAQVQEAAVRGDEADAR
jgi:HPr kinase/phosphorylase